MNKEIKKEQKEMMELYQQMESKYADKQHKSKETFSINNIQSVDDYSLCERMDSKYFRTTNVLFDNEINAELKLTYPFSVEVSEEVTFKSIYELIIKIRKIYQRIYKEEKKTMDTLIYDPMLINRGMTNGKYGIWGHEFADLYIEGIKIYHLNDIDKCVVTLYIGS